MPLALALFACRLQQQLDADHPTPTNPTFTATLSPANEVPPITNAESTVTGTASITLDHDQGRRGQHHGGDRHLRREPAGFPAGSVVNIAHIHEGATTCACPVVVNTIAGARRCHIDQRHASFTKAGVTVDPAVAQRILANPAGFYFNVHTSLNGGGVARGVLTRVS